VALPPRPSPPTRRSPLFPYTTLFRSGGAWVGSSSGETVADRNPAHTGEVLGQATVSTSEDVRHAIDAAERAFREWRATPAPQRGDRKSTRLNSSHRTISYAVFCLKKK